MSYNRFLERTWSENLLYSVLLELTYVCNLDCAVCYNDRELEGRPITRERYLDLLEDLADLQVMHLTFSGGEPLAHPDFLTLGRNARELGFVVRIKSNGYLLRDRLATRIRDEVDPFVVEVSLHGATAAIHDRQTRVPGSFDRLIDNVRGMVGLGLRVRINSLLTAWNEHELESTFDLADDLGVTMQVDPVVTPRDDGDRSPLEISASAEALARLRRIQSRRLPPQGETGQATLGAAARSRPEPGSPALGCAKNCGAGSSTLCIDPYGNVYPCVQWRRRVGNIHDQSISEIWRPAPALEQVRGDVVRVKGFVDQAGLVGFCPGVAEVETGSPTGAYLGVRDRLDHEMGRESSP